MKKLLLLSLSLFVSFVNAQNVNIPDAELKKALLNHFPVIDTNEDDEISGPEARAFSGTLNLYNKNISDLTGIEAFTDITELTCDKNFFTSLDVSKNTALTKLYCVDNKLTSLDVSKNTALTTLDFSMNQITSIDLSKNTALTILGCYDNKLTSFDFTNNTALSMLWCYSNQLTSLDVSSTLDLNTLECQGNENLSCINVIDEDNIPSGFKKDDSAEWSEDCEASLSNQDLVKTTFKAYPNPVNNRLTIDSKINASYSLVSVLGKVEVKGNLTAGNNSIDFSKLAKGVYILNINTVNGAEVLKVVKE